jgi:hypothetical protein
MEFGRTSKIRFSNQFDFKLRLVFKFRSIRWFPKFMHMHMRNHDNMLILYVPHQRKVLPNIDAVQIVGGKSLSFP